MIKTVTSIISVLTLIGIVIIALAGPGYRFGAWDLGMAFRIMSEGTPIILGGMGLTLLGMIVSTISGQRGSLGLGIITLILGVGLVYMLISMRSNAGDHPIHDLTTDFENPPAIITAATLERRNSADYVGGQEMKTGQSVQEIQQALYPDIKPIAVSKSPDVVFAAALTVMNELGWEILKSDQDTGTIEAAHTSLWFGFIDDFVLRIQPTPQGSRVDLRSKSRVGQSDLGANAKRIRDFTKRLEEAIS